MGRVIDLLGPAAGGHTCAETDALELCGVSARHPLPHGGKGEHLYAIAERYGTSIHKLCELNGISRRSILRVGQQLLVAEAGP